MGVGEVDHFQFTIKCYDFSGLRQSCGWFRRIMSVYIFFPLLLIMYVLMIINIGYQNDTIFDIAAIFESVSTFGYLVVRKTILLVKSSVIEELIRARSKFWNYDMFGKQSGDKFRRQMALCVYLLKCMWISSFFSIIFRCCTPLLVEGYVLPDACYIPRNNIYFTAVIYALEILFYVEVSFMFGVFDAFFLLLCTDLKIQFTLLKKALRTLDLQSEVTENCENKCWLQLKKCFKHHKFLLTVHEKLSKVFSEFFVCMYLLTIGGVCIQLFIILDGSANITHLIRSVIFTLVVNSLIALVVIPVGEIQLEAEKLSFEIYNINWYAVDNSKVRKFILFWLLKAQIPIDMTGAGMLRVNRSIMLQIPRVAFSVATVFNRMKTISS